MKYNPPFRATSDNQSFWNAAPGRKGAAVPREAVEFDQREIVAAIEAAGLEPSNDDLTQLTQAIRILIQRAMPEIPEVPDRFDLCEFYYFRHPSLKPGFRPAQGGLLANAATLYPEAWAYLQTTAGKKLCKTEAQWQAMTTATWATLADGTQVGWNGIGGVPFYAPNTSTGALRLPDMRGMYVEAAGFDSLDVGGVHGDAVRESVGSSSYRGSASSTNVRAAIGSASGIFYAGGGLGGAVNANWVGDSVGLGIYLNYAMSRVVPTANKVQGRAWGALACVYLGQPAS